EDVRDLRAVLPGGREIRTDVTLRVDGGCNGAINDHVGGVAQGIGYELEDLHWFAPFAARRRDATGTTMPRDDAVRRTTPAGTREGRSPLRRISEPQSPGGASAYRA